MLSPTPSAVLMQRRFEIDNATGQLRTDADLDYEAKEQLHCNDYRLDGSLTITITVIIIIIDLDDQKSPTLTLTSQPLTETTLNGSIVILSLSTESMKTGSAIL